LTAEKRSFHSSSGVQQAIFVRFILFPFFDRLPSHYVLIFFRQLNLITRNDLTDAAMLPPVTLKRTGLHIISEKGKS
jgi:hypothetical protein